MLHRMTWVKTWNKYGEYVAGNRVATFEWTAEQQNLRNGNDDEDEEN